MGFDPAQAIFNQVDTNQDGVIDRCEFSQWVDSGLGANCASVPICEPSACSNSECVPVCGPEGCEVAPCNLEVPGQIYPTDAQGNYQDPNPQVVRRPPACGPQTYVQNVRVRFLQPPPVPPPGVSYFLPISFFLSYLENFYFLATRHQGSTATSATCTSSASHPSTSSSSPSTSSTRPS